MIDPDEPVGNEVPEWARGVPRPQLFQGPGRWIRKNPPNTVERACAVLGMTPDSLRITALSRAVTEQPEDCAVIAKGQAGILAAYSALFCAKITQVTIIDPPASHRDGPYLLGVLKVCDIPEALGALAPKPLTLINAKDPAFDRTAELYKRAGAADKFIRK